MDWSTDWILFIVDGINSHVDVRSRTELGTEHACLPDISSNSKLKSGFPIQWPEIELRHWVERSIIPAKSLTPPVTPKHPKQKSKVTEIHKNTLYMNTDLQR